jgi:hypothetical protein
MELIDKDALVAEIERRRDLHYKYYRKNGAGSIAECKYDEDRDILSFIDTLEVKDGIKIGETTIYFNDDGGEAPYDGKQWLDLSCTEYEIPEDKFKDGDKVELIIRKRKEVINENQVLP